MDNNDDNYCPWWLYALLVACCAGCVVTIYYLHIPN